MGKPKTKKTTIEKTQPVEGSASNSSPNPQPDWRKNKKLLYIAGAISLVLIVGIGTYLGMSSKPTSQANQTASNDSNAKVATPAKTVDKTGALKLEKVTVGGCNALLPHGWGMPTTNDTSTTFDAFSSDKSMYAGYGHQAINTQLEPWAGAYSPPLNDPDLYSSDPANVAIAYTKIIVANLGGDNALSYTNETDNTFGDYRLRSVASATHKGVVFYHTKGFEGDGVNYTYSVPLYFALASTSAWQTTGLSLARVAASISCNAQLVARSSGPDIGGDKKSEDDANDDNDAGYNPQLGTEYVHDPTTGENYIVDPSRDWSTSGPNGGGYYAPKSGGNDYVQLQPGRSD